MCIVAQLTHSLLPLSFGEGHAKAGVPFTYFGIIRMGDSLKLSKHWRLKSIIIKFCKEKFASCNSVGIIVLHTWREIYKKYIVK